MIFAMATIRKLAKSLDELKLKRKTTFRFKNFQIVLDKKSIEKPEHVSMKALLWAMYIEEFPALKVEIKVGGRYKPDLVAQDSLGNIQLWVEAGRVKPAKVAKLASTHKAARIVIARWGNAPSFRTSLLKVLSPEQLNSGRITLINFIPEQCRECIDSNGKIDLGKVGYRKIGLNSEA